MFSLPVLVVCLLVSSSAVAITVDNHVTTGDPLASSGCTTPLAKTSFSANDDRAYLWIFFAGAALNDTVEWRWIAPNNLAYAGSEYIIPFTGNGCAWAWIDIKGQTAATLAGQWRVDVYLNGALATTDNFSIGTTPGPAPAAGAGAARLDFSVSDQFLVPWSYVHLSYRIKGFQPGLRADLYLALLLQGGGSQCIAPDRVFTSGLPAFATNLALSDSEAVIIERYLPAHVSPLVSTLYGVLVASGMSPGDPANWISNLAALDLAMGTLSSRQREIIVEQGNPQAFVIGFDHGRQQRVETWFYQQGPLGHQFQFINGGAVGVPGGGERARGTSAPPAAYDPGRFSPTTTPRQIRELLGDPDHVVPGSVPGREAWVFDSAGLTVTLENGVILQIEVY